MINFSSYWILPLLFMFHDFEELVFVPYWLKDHNPKINGRVLFGGVNRSDILAAGIWEEFCILFTARSSRLYHGLTITSCHCNFTVSVSFDHALSFCL